MFELPHQLLRRHSNAVASIPFVLVLNVLLAPRLSAAQRDILRNRVVLIGLQEGGLDCRVRWSDKGFMPCGPRIPVDLAIRARAEDFLQLLARNVDADALFFQRRLKLEGDIELGLAIKNMLDALELPSAPQRAFNALAKISGQLPPLPKLLRD